MKRHINSKSKTVTDMGQQQIVIADRGWVWVGKTSKQGDNLLIDDARCIRVWGTNSGLGQLALSGPTTTTKLDPVGRILVPTRAVIAIIACKFAW